MQDKLLTETTSVKYMKEIFRAIDADASGTITMEEMVRVVSGETVELQNYFEALGISAPDTVTLFELLVAMARARRSLTSSGENRSLDERPIFYASAHAGASFLHSSFF